MKKEKIKRILTTFITFTGAMMLSGCSVFTFTRTSDRSEEKTSSSFVEKSYECDSVRDFEILERSENVKIRRGDSDKLVIKYFVPSDRDNVEIEESNGCVSFERGRDMIVVFSGFTRPDTTTVVTLPKDFDGAIKASASSGNISVDALDVSSMNVETRSGEIFLTNIESKDKVTVKASSGDVEIESLKTEGELYVKTTSGEIDLINIESESDVTVGASSGSVEIASLETEGMLSIDTTSGDISLEAVNTGFVTSDSSSGRVHIIDLVCDRVSIETTSGDVDFKELTSDAIELRLKSGSVKGSIEGSQKDYSIDCDTSTGSSNLECSSDGAKSLYVKTTSGSIKVTFTK